MKQEEWQTGHIFAERYQIVKFVAEGGMSYIYQAKDLLLSNRLVALKWLKPNLASKEEWLQKEAGVLTSLKHAHLPIVYDFVREEPCIVMEWIEGETLTQVAQNKHWHELLSIFIQVAEAISYLHEQPIPIVHRDIKPANMMIDKQGQVKVIDFGICKFTHHGSLETAASLGTPGFASPEQLRGEGTTPLSDIYSYGMLLCFACSRSHFQAPPLHVNVEHWLKEHYAHLPRMLTDIIAQCIQIEPQFRIATMREVYYQLIRLEEAHKDKLKAGKSERELVNNARSKTKIVAVAAFDRRAGATTVSMACMQLLLARQKRHNIAFIEHPFTEANLSLSYLQRYVTSSSSFYHFFQLQQVQFYIQDGKYEYEPSERKKQFLQLVHSSEADIMVLDFSFYLSAIEELGLIHLIDELIVVASPDLYCMNEQQLLYRIGLLRRMHIPTHLIVNKSVKHNIFNELTALFPIKSAHIIPFASNEDMFKMKIKGEWLHPKSYEMKLMRKKLMLLNIFS